MSPSGYISLQEASRETGVPAGEIRKVANTLGLRQYQSKGNIVYKVEDFQKVLEVLKPSPKPAAGSDPVVEDIDIESLFAGQEGGSVDSGLFDNTGLSGSGLFDATDSIRPNVGEQLVSRPQPPEASTRVNPAVRPPAAPGKPSAPPAAPAARAPGEPPIRVVQGMPIPPGERPSRVGPGVASPPPAKPGEVPGRVGPGVPVRPPEQPSRVMARAGEPASRVGPAAPPPTPTARPVPPAPAAPAAPAAPPAPAARVPTPPAPAPIAVPGKPVGSSWVSDWSTAGGTSAVGVAMEISALAEEGTVTGGAVVDSVHQLFIDDSNLAEIKGLTRVYNQPVKFPGNPVVMPDTPWEEDGLCSLSGSVLYDREEFRFKMWYYAVTKMGRAACLAVSADGIRWEKPDCGVLPYNNSGTNIIMANPAFDGYAELCSVIKDTTDEPARWYKAVYQYQNTAAGVRGLKTAVSPDGIRWTPTETLITSAVETAHFLRDERTGKYVIYGRLMRQGRRAVQRLQSEDFRTWSAGEPVMEPDARDAEGDDIYSLDGFPYGRQYIGLVQMFHSAPHYTLDVQLAVSRDGVHWERPVGRNVFLPPGKVGEWDRFQLSPAGRPAVIGGKELWFYYGCRAFRHPPYLGADKGLGWGAIGLARLRRDGFAHLEGSFDGGSATTQPIVLRGAELRVNAAAAHGAVQVALLDKDGKPLDGMTGKVAGVDGVDCPVVWDGGKTLSGRLGRPVRLAFTLKNARLYSYWMQ